ncbi:MAG: hypothetical protein AVDCRST_MAG93-4549 [uncultured Chloroflexia bacterium]|uniref:Uncharacterized protein n=1 Tax=uncultured Chloroflexia bacterium TaxID=1672391 RepID=A0A6J4KB55_9CHLR|nr:MAG: hypothetical protein AVDCRST_MAG93-4549 [uncultured Chloroflexia bacterium]
MTDTTQIHEVPASNGVVDDIPKFNVKSFNATHVKHFALLLSNVINDQQAQNAINFVLNNMGDSEKIRGASGSLIGAFLGIGLQEAADQLDSFLASLLDISVEEFGKQDAAIYPETIKSLIEHDKFAAFLRSARGLGGVIGTRWSTFS